MGLFGKLPLRIIEVTGPKGSGKTTFMLGLHPYAKHMDGPPKILCFDDEMGASLYSHIYNYDLVDFHMDPRFSGKSLADKWAAFVELWKGVKPGEYDVCALDTIWFLEQCLDAWVEANPGEFDKTAGQYKKMPAIKGADLKGYLHVFIMQEILTKVEVLAYSAHERSVWKNDKPTREVRPYGKSTWQQLAHLVLRLDRSIPPGKTSADPVPRATVLSTRLRSATGQPVLPPAFREATGDTIRKFIENPSNWKKLKKDEVIPVHTLSEEEKQEREAELLDKQLEVAEAQKQVIAMRQEQQRSVLEEYEAKGKPADEAAVAAKTEDKERAVAAVAAVAGPRPEQPATTEEQPATEKPSRISPEEAAQIITIAKLVNAKQPKFWDAFMGGIKKYTVGETGLPADIAPEFLPRIRGRLNEVAEANGVSTEGK